MNAVANSILLKMALLLFASCFAVIGAGLTMRRIRKVLGDGDALPAIPVDLSQLRLPPSHSATRHLQRPENELSIRRDADSRANNSRGETSRVLL